MKEPEDIYMYNWKMLLEELMKKLKRTRNTKTLSSMKTKSSVIKLYKRCKLSKRNMRKSKDLSTYSYIKTEKLRS